MNEYYVVTGNQFALPQNLREEPKLVKARENYYKERLKYYEKATDMNEYDVVPNQDDKRFIIWGIVGVGYNYEL